jgi:excinuclease ABC subunit B
MLKLHSLYKPKGDQPEAIKKLTANLNAGVKHQTLLGVTGSGKTFTMANVIAKTNRPALVISHNKTLTAQLYQEFKEFFPENPVRYFVSYYDYYQPEAYLPATDTYIEKDASINEFIDKLRHASTQTALTRKDFVIVSSVSCIYGIGDPEEYEKIGLELKRGLKIKHRDLLSHLALLQYERNDREQKRGAYSVKGDVIKIISPDGETSTTIEMFGNMIENITVGENNNVNRVKIFPAKHFVTPKEKLNLAIKNIKIELSDRLKALIKTGKIFEAERLKKRVNFDLEMMRETGYCAGIENYSRHLSFRDAGDPPYTLLDYLPKNTLIFIDESHITIPQINGMYAGDKNRKTTLVEHGFRLPSALDNRPLKFNEFNEKIGQIIYVSATPGEYELQKSRLIFNSFSKSHKSRIQNLKQNFIVEQLIRPTGLLDPKIEIRPALNQIQDVIKEVKKCKEKKERAILVTLTKRLAEEISDFLQNYNINACYIHSEIKTLERPRIIQLFREGEYDVLVGVNLLREGLDLPEVALIAVLDADKEGFLRNATTLIQTIGRVSRHINGKAILYAEETTKSMKKAIEETARRRRLQKKYNKTHNIKPAPIKKEVKAVFENAQKEKTSVLEIDFKKINNKKDLEHFKNNLKQKMMEAAYNYDFKKAAELRDLIKEME